MVAGAVGSPGVKIDPEEIERIVYYSVVDLSALLDEEEPVFSHQFAQLLHLSTGKPSALDLVRYHP